MPVDSSLGSGQTVCVTGAGGFIASWIVKLLLERGYSVRGTVRNPDDPKNAHLRGLEGAEERLRLYRADLLDFESLKEAVKGCDGVFHAASPVTDDPEMVEPAVNGTKNVIIAASEVCVSRVVFTSTIGAVYMDPNRSPDVVVDESCWSDLEFCKNTRVYVHVRDVALAHILVFESPSASGRYLCGESALHRGEVVEILAKFFPEYPIPTKCSDEVNPRAKPYKFTNQKLKELGLEFTPVKQCLYETVKSLQENGHLPFPNPRAPPSPTGGRFCSYSGMTIHDVTAMHFLHVPNSRHLILPVGRKTCTTTPAAAAAAAAAATIMIEKLINNAISQLVRSFV